MSHREAKRLITLTRRDMQGNSVHLLWLTVSLTCHCVMVAVGCPMQN